MASNVHISFYLLVGNGDREMPHRKYNGANNADASMKNVFVCGVRCRSSSNRQASAYIDSEGPNELIIN